MKKIIASLFAVLALSAAMQAQQIGSNRFGVDVGFTSSSANVSDFKVSNVSGFHAGVYYQIPLVSGLSLQPGIQYQMKGANLGTAGDANVKWLDTVMHYIEVPVQIQYGIDLMYLRPYAFAEPFIGMAVGTKSSTAANQEQTDPGKAALNRLEYGLGVGVGLEVWRMQFAFKYFWNFGNLYNGSTQEVNDVSTAVKTAFDGKNFNGFSITVGFFF